MLDKLRRRYPLLTFTENSKCVVVEYGTVKKNILLDENIIDSFDYMLTNWHLAAMLEVNIMKTYDDIVAHVHMDQNDIFVAIWVKRDGKAAEFIDKSCVTKLLHNDYLQKMQDMAKDAKLKNHFLCSGHSRPEHISEYDYTWFSSKFCKLFGKEHPSHKLAAISERND